MTQRVGTIGPYSQKGVRNYYRAHGTGDAGPWKVHVRRGRGGASPNRHKCCLEGALPLMDTDHNGVGPRTQGAAASGARRALRTALAKPRERQRTLLPGHRHKACSSARGVTK